MIKDTALYSRVSTQEQARKDLSIPEQFRQCRQYAERHEYGILIEEQDEDTGALVLQLPGMDRLRAAIKQGIIKRIIVLNQSRLARDELGYFTLRAEFRRYGVEVHAVNRGGKIDGLYASLEAVLDADEKERIRDRTVRGRVAKAKQGRIVGAGPPPFGYTRHGTGDAIVWVIDDAAAATVRLIYRLYTDDLLSLHEIAEYLTSQGVPSPSDRRPAIRRKRGPASWQRETIRNILDNPAYAGTFYANRTTQGRGDQVGKRPPIKKRPPEDWIPIPVPAIIDQAVFDAAQARRATGKHLSFRNTKHDYLVGRRVRCQCGYACTARTSSLTGYNTKQYPYYICNTMRSLSGRTTVGERCGNQPFRADRVDAAVWLWVRDVLLVADRLREIIARRDSEARAAPDTTANIQHQRTRLSEQVDRLNTAYLAGAYPLDEYLALKRDLDTQRLAIDTQINAIPPRPMPAPETAIRLVEQIVGNWRVALEHPELPFTTKRFLIDRLDIHVTLHRNGDQATIEARCDLFGVTELLPLV